MVEGAVARPYAACGGSGGERRSLARRAFVARRNMTSPRFPAVVASSSYVKAAMSDVFQALPTIIRSFALPSPSMSVDTARRGHAGRRACLVTSRIADVHANSRVQAGPCSGRECAGGRG